MISFVGQTCYQGFTRIVRQSIVFSWSLVEAISLVLSIKGFLLAMFIEFCQEPFRWDQAGLRG